METKEQVKYTPGPWHMEQPDGQLAWTILDSENNPIAYVQEFSTAPHGEDSEDTRHARLIAAAPELLEELKEALAWANISDESRDRPLRDRWLAAIAKAEWRE